MDSKDYYKIWVSANRRIQRRSRRRTGNWRANITPMSIRGIRPLRLVSKKSTRPTRCFPTRRNGGSTILLDSRISLAAHRAPTRAGVPPCRLIMRIPRASPTSSRRSLGNAANVARPRPIPAHAPSRNTCSAAWREYRAAHRNLAARRLAGTRATFTVEVTEPCPVCHGTGFVRQRICATCGGTGTTSRSRKLEVQIPPGVDTGSKVRVTGAGQPGSERRAGGRSLSAGDDGA